jgi:hypothetical protein
MWKNQSKGQLALNAYKHEWSNIGRFEGVFSLTWLINDALQKPGSLEGTDYCRKRFCAAACGGKQAAELDAGAMAAEGHAGESRLV